jgi:hypothetical protein
MKKNDNKNTENENDYNLLTANIGNPSIAENIIEGIVIDCRCSETTIDSLAIIFEAFANQKSLVDVQDFAHNLQRALFTYSKDFDEAIRTYIETVKQGKDYKAANTVIAS